MRRFLPITIILLACAVAQAGAGFGSLPEPAAEPGEYLTFSVPVTGNGTYVVTLTGPSGWQFVSSSREVAVDGSRLVPFTVRVPSTALADERVELRVRIQGADGGAETEGSISVRVRGSSGMTLTEAAPARAAPGEILSFTVKVTNTGNRPDIFRLTGHSPGRLVHVNPEQLLLGPFETGEAEVTVPVQGSSHRGYRLPLKLELGSENSGSVTVKSIEAIYDYEDTSLPTDSEAHDPELRLRVRTVANTGVEVGSESGTSPFFSWSVQPGLKGDLSDFVELNATTDGFGSGTDSLFEAPRHTNVELTAEDWEAALLLGENHFGVRGAFEAVGWRFSGGGFYGRYADLRTVRFEAGARSGDPALDLQFQSSLLLADGYGSGSLSGFWRNRLTDDLQLGLGIGLTSYRSTGGRSTDLTFNESLQWLTQDFDVVQTLTSSPSLGLHSLSLSGGMRSEKPFGLRFLTRFSTTPSRSQFVSGLQASTVPLRTLRLAAGVFHEIIGFSSGRASSLRVQAGARLRFPVGSGASADLNVDSAWIAGLTGDARSGNIFSVRVALESGRLALRAAGSRESWNAQGDAAAELKVRLRASALYSLSAASQIEAALILERGTTRDTSFSVRWIHEWSERFSSEVRWRHRRRVQHFDVDLTARDVFTEGLTFGVGYGLVLGAEETAHRFTAGVSYTWILPFRTPDALVSAFGGRETGTVTGVARISEGDRAGEPLGGLTVRLGDTATTTAADGSFTLYVPEGQYRLEFDGLPATLGLSSGRELRVERNGTETVTADFVPISVLHAIVFLDGDRDGKRSEAEAGLSGITLELEGPKTSRAVTDSNGSAWLTGLPGGHYQLRIDERSLPTGFEPVDAPTEISIDPSGKNPPLELGIAPIVRKVVTTFQSGSNRLSLNAWASAASVRPGAELTVFARAGETAETVTLEFFGQSFSLEHSGNLWQVDLTVPEGQAGLTHSTVTARTADGREAETRIQLLVTQPE